MPRYFQLVYTRPDPTAVAETDPIVSLGGYTSVPNNGEPIQVFESTTLTDEVEPEDTEIPVVSVSEASGLVCINGEVVEYSGFGATPVKLTGVKRGLSTGIGLYHGYGDSVFYLDTARLFGSSIAYKTAYVCVAIKTKAFTVGAKAGQSTFGSTATKMGITLYQERDSDVSLDYGIEIPKWQELASIASAAGTTTTLIDTVGLAAYTTPDYFVGGHIIIDIDGTWLDAVITAYDVETSTLTFDREAGRATDITDVYRIHAAPSQSISSMAIAPSTNEGRFLGFVGDGGPTSPYGDEVSLASGSVVYVWLKQTLSEDIAVAKTTHAILQVKAALGNPQIYDTTSQFGEAIASGTVTLTNRGGEPCAGVRIKGRVSGHTLHDVYTTTDKYGRFSLHAENFGSVVLSIVDLDESCTSTPASRTHTLASGNFDDQDFSIECTKYVNP
jgi:hypothetical protein